MSDPAKSTTEKAGRFVQLFAGSQRRLYAFIRAQVRSPADVDDILQQTSLILWEKFDRFEPGTDFAAWACRIARLEVLTHHRNSKKLIPVFSQSVVADALIEELAELTESLDDRQAALADCFEKLDARDQNLVLSRYEEDLTIQELALRSGRTESAVYKALSRIYDKLFDCIESSLKN